MIWLSGMAIGIAVAWTIVSSNHKSQRTKNAVVADAAGWLEASTGVRPEPGEEVRVLQVVGVVDGRVAPGTSQVVLVATPNYLVVQTHSPPGLDPRRVIMTRSDVGSLRCSRRDVVSDPDGRFEVFSRPRTVLPGVLEQLGWLVPPPART